MTPGDLERMRAAVASRTATGLFPSAPVEHPGALERGDAPRDPRHLVDTFCERLEALGGSPHVFPTTSAAADHVLALSKRLGGAAAFVAWEDGEPLVAAASAALRADGWRQVSQVLGAPPEGRQAQVHDIAGCQVGITGAEAALAATGSVVLRTGPGRGRLASLLPPVHVVLVEAARLAWSLAEFLRAQADSDRSSNLVIVTGPSRTADIEMTLSRGVHGPREIHVLLVGDGR